MRLPSVNDRGVIPILPLVGLLILAVGVAVAGMVITSQNSQDIRSQAAEQTPAVVPPNIRIPEPTITPPAGQKTFKDLLPQNSP